MLSASLLQMGVVFASNTTSDIAKAGKSVVQSTPPPPPTPPPGLPIDNALIYLFAIALLFAFYSINKYNKKTPSN